MHYETMQETDETVIFQKLRKRAKAKDQETWKKETRKPWRKIQKEKQKIKYNLLQFCNVADKQQEGI